MLGPSGFFLPVEAGYTEPENTEFELIRTSEDGFNSLYRVCKNGRFFVYKALREEYRGNPLYENLLNKDFNIGFSLSHNNICQYLAKIQHPAIGSCIVMEWIDGCNLEELLHQRKIDDLLARKIICEICDALEYMHNKQVIHRDLKPENILITHNGQNVKIIDFGLSDTDSYNTFKAPAGTRLYASPELVAGDSIDLRSDIWSLGVIINEISRKYHNVAARCMRRDPNKRFTSAAEVKKAIFRERSRKLKLMLGWAACIIAVALCVLLGLKEQDSPIEVNDIQTNVTHESPDDTTQRTEAIHKEAVQEIKNEPAPKPAQTKSINSQELEDLLNSAAQSIL